MKIDPRMINDFFPFLVFLTISIIAMVGSYYSLKKQKAKMKEIALKLGLEFKENEFLSFKNPNTRSYAGYHRPSDAGFDIQGIIKKIMAAFSPWQVIGKYNGYSIIIKTERKDKKSFTIVQLNFERPLGMGLNIMMGNMISRIGKNIFGKQSISTGNPDIDSKIYISGQDEMKVKYLTKRPEFQQMLLSLYNKYPRIRVDDNGITYKEKKVLTEYAAYKTLLDSLSGAAKAFAG